MIKEKIKFIFVFIVVSIIIVISATYLGYYMYYDGYIASDINTGNCITYAIEQVLLSENSLEKKKEFIEKFCSYSYSEIIVENVSDKTIFYKKESGFINKKLFNKFPLMGKLIKTKDGNYSIEYKTYVPKFYTCVTYCLYLGKHMTRI